MHNLREGAYNFEGNAQLSNSNRFRIRFSKPTVFSAEGETCSGFDGEIGIESQAGIWNYTLSNAAGQTISNGTSEDQMLFENLAGGDYIMQLVHNNYEVAMNITVASSQTVDALIMSSDVAYAMEPKSFAVVASNATEIVWNFGDGSEVLLGESVTHTYEQAGVYTLSLTASNDECSYGVYQTIEVLTPNVTGMEETAKNAFRMLPNPAQSMLTFVKVGSSIANIEIVDLSGKVVARETLSSTAQTIDISALASGVYSVTFTQDAIYAVQKLVVQK
jgi:PKD repeat protein